MKNEKVENLDQMFTEVQRDVQCVSKSAAPEPKKQTQVGGGGDWAFETLLSWYIYVRYKNTSILLKRPNLSHALLTEDSVQTQRNPQIPLFVLVHDLLLFAL